MAVIWVDNNYRAVLSPLLYKGVLMNWSDNETKIKLISKNDDSEVLSIKGIRDFLGNDLEYTFYSSISLYGFSGLHIYTNGYDMAVLRDMYKSKGSNMRRILINWGNHEKLSGLGLDLMRDSKKTRLVLVDTIGCAEGRFITKGMMNNLNERCSMI